MNNVFFVELCKFPFFRNAVDTFSGNSLQPNISSEQVESIQIPVPPLELQNRFADFVRQADKSKFELQKTVNELEATYKSLLRENLG
jgi:type I restriction enzyme S subunit